MGQVFGGEQHSRSADGGKPTRFLWREIRALERHIRGGTRCNNRNFLVATITIPPVEGKLTGQPLQIPPGRRAVTVNFSVATKIILSNTAIGMEA
jgi:hypothetical protein